MEQREELPNIGLRWVDYSKDWEQDTISQPIPHRYVPNGKQKRQRDHVRNSLEEATHLIRYRNFTIRDYEILHTLATIGIMSTNQIHRLYWPNSQSSVVVTNRLAKLFYRHVLDQTPDCRPYFRQIGLAPGIVYTLGKVGAAALYLEHGVNRGALKERKRYQIGRGASLLFHDLMVAEFYIRLQLALKPLKATVGWYSEELGNVVETGGRELVRPDGTATVIIGEQTTSYALEVDRAGTQWDEKLRAYESAWDRQRWNRVESETPYLDGILVVVIDSIYPAVKNFLLENRRHTDIYLKSWTEFIQTSIDMDWFSITDGPTVMSLPGLEKLAALRS